ncbi:mannosyltransferase family protein [Catellatospora tritici]|uniref:mannosyltransferase family protein n=1 Tax=Catellatospora tritici TaxID=2851566 RepID=UPI001C2D7BDB|nr:mannosyltransferase family protein [Catellatospora tritici]MBV1854874.1 glycosyltransferase family 39 protein [Catellatospora tritici]
MPEATEVDASAAAADERPDATEPARSVASGWRESARAGLVTWAAGLLLYAVTTYVAWLPVQDLPAKAGNPPTGLGGALDAWNRWDVAWYLPIADTGYQPDPLRAAFFPLYPMLVRAVRTVTTLTTFHAAMLVSVLACLAALILLHRLATELLDAEHGRRAAFYLLAFPTGLYLVAAYNESLFLALSVGALYCMRRGRWWYAGLLCGLAGATRLTGLLLGLAFGYEYLRRRDWSVRRVRWDVLAALLVPAGVVLFALHLHRVLGNATAFLDAQKHWFRDGYQAPWTTYREVVRLISEGTMSHPDTVRNTVNLVTSVGSLVLLALAVVGPWKLGRGGHYLIAFALPAMLLPVVNPVHNYYPLASVWRYFLECVPAFLVLARMGGSRTFDRIYPVAAIGLQGVMVVTFVQNNFVG